MIKTVRKFVLTASQDNLTLGVAGQLWSNGEVENMIVSVEEEY